MDASADTTRVIADGVIASIANALNLPPDDITPSKSLVQLGGDSLDAIEVARLCYDHGITLQVHEILGSASIADILPLAKYTGSAGRDAAHGLEDATPKPFELLPPADVDAIVSEVRSQCGLSSQQVVEEAYPCTPLQEGFMALSLKQPGSYIQKMTYKLSDTVDPAQFKAAWEKTVEMCDNLRTRIVLFGGTSVQAALKGDVSWEKSDSLRLATLSEDMARIRMTFGSRLSRYALLQDNDGAHYFVWLIHHSVFDGWVQQLVLDTLAKVYHEQTPTVTPFSGFIKYTTGLDKEASRQYWHRQLDGARSASWPTAPLSRKHDDYPQIRLLRKAIDFSPLPNSNSTVTKASILRAAWAIVLARYCDTRDICFGTVASGRNAPVPGMSKMAGPTLATVPVRMALEESKPVAQFLREVQIQALEAAPHEQYGLQNISKLSRDAENACGFTSLMVVQPSTASRGNASASDEDAVFAPSESELLGADETLQGYFNYPLVAQAFLGEENVELLLAYDSQVLNEPQLQLLANHFDHVVQQLRTETDATLGSVSIAGPSDFEQASAWGKQKYHLVEDCVHDIISKRAEPIPDHPALYSSDISLTYSQLDTQSSRFANRLAQLGLSRGDAVAFCLEKSVWAVVALLGILKAGGSFTPLDPSHPRGRRQEICDLVQAKFLIASPTVADACDGLTPNLVTLDPALLSDSSISASSTTLPTVSPDDTAYIIFTSGSTGKPKGIVIHHSAFSSSVSGMVDMLGINGDSRTLQFSNYVFDASTLEIFPTLVAGGTLCVPTDTGRLQNTAGFIAEAQANVVFLTPSFSRTISPEEVPTVKTLIVGGEAPVRDTLDRWHGFVKLINAYGPSEVCVMCNYYEYPSRDSIPTTIGQGLSHTSWVVEPDDPNTLAPIGCVGELLIQGHALAKGYLNDDVRTRQAFLEDVRWIPPSHAHNGTRFYRTGDLVRYNLDGTLEFLGRKDTQVKVRGQRLELGEVEDRMKKVAPEIKHAAADVITHDERQALVAFISFAESGQGIQSDHRFMPIDETMREFFASMSASLKNELPGYMVPTVFLPLYEMPIMAGSMKLDRGRLRAFAGELSQDELAEFTLASRNKVAPATEMEFRVRELWSTVLGLSVEEIGRHDDFLQIGGDSISAIKLAAQAQKDGLQLSVGDIFEKSQLADMAVAAVEFDATPAEEYVPFSIVGSGKTDLIQATRTQCRLMDSAEVEDIYPTTAFQEGLMALAVKQPGTYIAKYLYRLRSVSELERVKAAWEQTMDRCENLRTRIVNIKGHSFQVLVKNDVYWEPTQNVDLASFKSASQILQMNYGSRLNRYGIIQEGPEEFYFFWISHHAVFDGWTVGLVLDTFFQAYETMEAPSLQPYASFIKHIANTNLDESVNYWKKQLDNAQRASFPALPSSSSQDKPSSTRTMQTSIEFSRLTSSSITKATFLRAAWAIILGRYCDNGDVTFGSSVSGRNAPVVGLQNMPGPAVSTVPVRVRLDGKQSVLAFLQGIQDQALKMVPYEQFGLQNISKLSPEARDACDFSSLLVVQPLQKHLSLDREDNQFLDEVSGKIAEDSMEGYFTYPLVIQAHLLDDSVDLHLTYDAEVLSNTQVMALSNHFEHVTLQLLERNDATLGDIDIAGPWDLQQATRWNAETPEVIHFCVHELMEKQAMIRPDAPAVCASDLELSYRELNEGANRLAHYLAENYNIMPGDFVLACFEKSAWYMVAIMAINKAGGAWVPIDPAHPTSRHQQIAGQTGARVILSSKANMEICKRVMNDIIEVSATTDQDLQGGDPLKTERGPHTTVVPTDPAYVLFTSGSTGVPKGLIMEHRGACSAQNAITKRFGMTPNVRMLQFAAFVFDFSIGEIIGPIINGAAICIPSDEARMNDIQGFIREKNVTWTYLTPAFARTLRPPEVPSLELLVLGGEAVTQDLFDRWFGKVRFANGWGPAETCCLSSAYEWTSKTQSPLTIGTPMGAYLWITEPNNPDKLAPIGTLGEVIIQGPGVMRGYLGLPEQTAKTMLTKLPSWAQEETLAISDRFYRTGDLCYYNSDGTIEFYSRNDTQVKIRGLRIELGEIEHNFSSSLAGVRQVAVDVFKPAGSQGDPKLVAYFCLSTETKNTALLGGSAEETFLPLDADLRDRLGAAIGELNVKLPSYMVPTIFVPCRYMPISTSTKIDRRGLKGMMATLSQEEISAYSLVSGTKRPPETALEAHLQTIWAEILNIPAESIGRDDSFLRIGGDSITAIRLVAVAREEGFLLTVKDIFADPRLSSIASKLEAVDGNADDLLAAISPFDLLEASQRDVVVAEAQKQCALSEDQTVVDSYPCNPLQEGFMLSSLKQPGSYIAKWAFKVGEDVDLDRFKSAWEATLQQCPNLRTRMVQIGDASIQVILSQDNQWEDTTGMELRDLLNKANTFEMSYGNRLNRYGLVRESSGETYFGWIVHHSIYDGWTMRLVFHTLTRIYQSQDPAPLTPYVNFIKFTRDLDWEAARAYWGQQLKDATRAAYPAPSTQLSKAEDEVMAPAQVVKATIEYSQSTSSITQASIMRAAWAIVLGRYCDTDDVTFGVAVSGRQAPVPGLEEMPGPMVATLPIRVQLDGRQSVAAFLQGLQDQGTDMINYEQFGIQNISSVSVEAKEACDFSSLLVIEPAQEFVEDDSGSILTQPSTDKWDLTDSLEGYSEIPLVLKAQVGPGHIDLSFISQGGVLNESDITALSHQLEHVIEQLSKEDETPLHDVSVAGPWDLERAKALTGTPERIEACAHDLITQKAATNPDKQAIFSSEIILTYADLDRLSDQLAGYLTSQGVGLGVPVPICYEKSPWVIVFMVSIMKAGGVYIPFDPEHPIERRRDLVNDLGAKHIIVSPTTATDCEGLTPSNIVIDPANFSQYAEFENQERATVTPNDVAFILFTSGSTGKPKGVVMEHGTLCSSCILGFGKSFGQDTNFRVLQFSNYVFDVSIAETFGVFLAGGTVCVPNETERLQETTKFINAAQVDIAILTPSFSRALDPVQIPSLKKLVLGGEPLTKDTMEQWFDHVELLNAYGPAEACVCSNVHVFQTKQETSSNIGTAVNASLWIVDPEDHERLAPIGCVGELVIQGNVARGYLNNEEQTSKAFIDSVSWLATTPGSARFYKTGDLVKYKSNGDMEILGRKDTQVKIRGQRMESGEIEYQIKKIQSNINHVAVDVVRHGSRQTLVAFLGFSDEKAEDAQKEGFFFIEDELRHSIASLATQLSTVLPGYMVPSLFLPVRSMPFVSALKLDRKRLREQAHALTQEQISDFALSAREMIEPANENEYALRDVWAHILHVEAETISTSDSFLEIGGNSISAIQLVSQAQQKGMNFTASDVFSDARLSSLAALSSTGPSAEDFTTEPFSLIGDDLERVKAEITAVCLLKSGQTIEDAYPCAPIQQGLMALSVKQPGSYIAKNIYKLSDDIDVAQFKAAWERTAEVCANLRTRIIQTSDQQIQAVISGDIEWENFEGKDLSGIWEAGTKVEMTYGSRLNRYAVASDSTGAKYFVWFSHHSVFDGWLVHIVLETLQCVYRETGLPRLRPFSNFINWVSQMDASATEAYWRQQLRGAQPASFPPKSNNALPSVTRHVKKLMSIPDSNTLHITTASLLRGAWAMLLARYCDTDDVTFGATVSGRNAPVPGVDVMPGVMISTNPIRVRLNPNQSVKEYLQSIQDQSSEMISYEQFGLHNIAKLGTDIKDACDFSSLMVIQPAQQMGLTGDDNALFSPVDIKAEGLEDSMQGYFSYPLVMQCVLMDGKIELHLTYDASVLKEEQLQAMAHQYEATVLGLLSSNDQRLGDVQMTSSWDVQKAQEFNSIVPEAVESTIHKEIEKQARLRPDAPAIYAWDGEFTYAELDAAASRLAHLLVTEYKVKVGDIVHVCFYKSAWHLVSILAVNKAGAAWSPIDPTHPLQRKQQITKQTKAKILLTSAEYASMGTEMLDTVIEVSPKAIASLANQYPASAPVVDVSPEDVAYVLFTSGSTGVPKGFVIRHRSLCSCQHASNDRLGLDENVRMLQFAAFVFDLSIGEIFGTLIAGGCLCIPSEKQRMNNLREFIRESKSTWAYLTPAFARILRPESVPSLKLLMFAGEAVPRDVFEQWFGKARLINAWGPAEASTFSSFYEYTSLNDSAGNIGKPVGNFCWIVDPADSSKLAPIGTAGEVVIQGPTLLREYIGDPVKTAESTVDNIPEWAHCRDLPLFNRFFKSGDLCYYNPDGTMEFVSRKDTQVKIRGLRVELGEVEHHILLAMEGVSQIVVDVLRNEAGAHLVAYFASSMDTRTAGVDLDPSMHDMFGSVTPELTIQLTALVGELSIALPGYMVPSLFIPCHYMPLNTSAKVDRKALRQHTANLSRDTLQRYALVSGEKRPPETSMEKSLQAIWAEVLNLKTDSIGRDDSFLRIGGDSIAVTRLVSLAASRGISLIAKDIFDDPRLFAVSSKACEIEAGVNDDIPYEAFSLLDKPGEEFIQNGELEKQYCLYPEEISDAYPCTPLQDGLIALSMKQPGSYITRYLFNIPEGIDRDRLKRAWERTVQRCDNLHTRIIKTRQATLQVLVKDDNDWEDTTGTDVESFVKLTNSYEMTYGSRLCRYALINQPSGDYLLWIIHHSVIDGWSIRIVQEILQAEYWGMETPTIEPYPRLVQYTQATQNEPTRNFWRQQLEGAEPLAFPPKPYDPEAEFGCHIEKIPIAKDADTSITKASMLRAAWSIVLASHNGSREATFGATVSGRNAPVSGIQNMAGPAIATVPVRIRQDPNMKLKEFLHGVQTQASDMTAYEQFGMHNISRLGQDEKEACDFNSLIVIQPQAFTVPSAKTVIVHGEYEHQATSQQMTNFFNYPLVLLAILHESHYEVRFFHNPASVAKSRVEAIGQQLKYVLQQLTSRGKDRLLGDIQVSGDWDYQKAVEYHLEAPLLVDEAFPTLVDRQATLRPDAIAVRAVDRSFTFGELNECANRFAHHLLQDYAVKPAELVQVCFEKSAWYIVAILAINKAGAAWVPLDPSHPRQRHEEIVRQTGATLILTSAQNAELCAGLTKDLVQVSADLDDKLLQDEQYSSSSPTIVIAPRDPMYVLFTSGSTGTPKGIIMEHGAVCTSQVDIAKRLGLGPGVNILQFSAFVFDVSVGEIVGPLITGATVSIPSDHVRLNSLAQFINDMEVTWAYLTPAFARTLKPTAVPNLELLLLAGEAVGNDVFETWYGQVRLVNGYGPAETCCFSIMHEWTAPTESPLTIGRPVGSFCWIVDADDSSRLAPIGTEGEIIIQGPTLLREYLGDPEKTARATLTELPSWAPRRDSLPWSRAFKSGDLGSYNSDGSIKFSSRKDTQVKIRGLRIELGEIEHHIQASLPTMRQIAVDVYASETKSQLVAFICDNERKLQGEHADLFSPLSSDLKDQISTLLGKMSISLPQYMIPSIFIPCNYMPVITSGKLDRKALRALASGLNAEQLGPYTLSYGVKRATETPMEARLQKIWAKILVLPVESIGRDDNFLRIGGDSINAIELVSAANDEGILITTDDIFRDPRLCALAEVATEMGDHEEAEHVPFSLLEGRVSKNSVEKAAPINYEIEDAYPCTPLQEGLMALSERQPGSYIAKHTFKLLKTVDLDRFREAWEETMELCANLRTRIILADNIPIQVHVKDDVEWEKSDGLSLRSFLRYAKTIRMTYNTRLCRYALVEDEGAHYFVWICHHTVFDGWTMRLVLGTLFTAYSEGLGLNLQPYARFIEHTLTANNDTAKEYWRSQLRGVNRATFPPTARPDLKKSKGTRILNKSLDFPPITDSTITKGTLLRATWAIVLASYCETDDICFGTTVSGRQTPIQGVAEMPGPMVATVPVRVRLDGEETIDDFLQDLQTQSSRMVPYEQYGLQNISKLGSEVREACDFSSLLVIQPFRKMFSPTADDEEQMWEELEEEIGDGKIDESLEGFVAYPLVVQGHVANTGLDLSLIYNADILSEEQMNALAHHFNQVIQSLITKGSEPLSSISVAGQWDLDQALTWNRECFDLKERVSTCVHDLISKQADSAPDLPALLSTEATLTFGQLARYSDAFANHLISLGVVAGTRVPFCLVKSVWGIVAMVGILKAGGTFIPLDPGHPYDRRLGLIEQLGAQHLVVSPGTIESCEGLAPHIIQLSPASLEDLVTEYGSRKPTVNVTPEDGAYILFTSGTTGQPKGIVIEHGPLCTSLTGQSKLIRFDTTTRMIQFGSFTFDASIAEMFTTLISGGGVCVPTDAERLQAPQFMTKFGVTTALLTPSFVRTFSPSDVPDLHTLVVLGEAPSKDIMDIWYGKVSLMNAYGPTEVCMCNATQLFKSSDSPTTIGKGFVHHNWIVDPKDHNKLAPIGSIGELLVQGYALARGYLNDEEKTKNAFIDSVAWMPVSNLDTIQRFYKTGDLVRYNLDGTIQYCGRKDTQVKVRGQRVELGEIEAAILESLPSVENAVADVVKFEDRQTLVAFLSFTDKTLTPSGENYFVSLEENLQNVVGGLSQALQARLPGYMVPTFYLPVAEMPFMQAMKVDRKKLRANAAELSMTELGLFTADSRVKVEPTTDMEFKLRDVWAQILDVPAENIGKHDNFLQIGGDSISAIKLASLAQAKGFGLTVANIFKDSRLSTMALSLASGTKYESLDVEPFSQVSPDVMTAVMNEIEKHDELGHIQGIENVSPTHITQDAFIAGSTNYPGTLQARRVWRIPKHVDVELFRDAWNSMIQHFGILRSRIYLVGDESYLAVLKEKPEWEDVRGVGGVKEYIRAREGDNMTYGSRLHRQAIVEEDNEYYFVWIQHHCIADGWTFGLLMNALQLFYKGLSPPPAGDYAGFVKFARNVDVEGATDFWSRHLEGAEQTTWPRPRTPETPYKGGVTETLSRGVQLPSLDASITPATIMTGAWALALSRLDSRSDVCFTRTSSGRQAPLEGLETVAGLTTARVPVRVQIDQDISIAQFLSDIQNTAAESVPYEHFGSKNIAKLLPASAAPAILQPTSLLLLQPAKHLNIETSEEDTLIVPAAEKMTGAEALDGFYLMPLVTDCFLGEDRIDLHSAYNRHVVSKVEIEAFHEELERLILHLCTRSGEVVASVFSA